MIGELTYTQETEVNKALESYMDRPMPFDGMPEWYMFGLWLEAEFNAGERWGVDWQVLHKYAKAFCEKHELGPKK